MYSPLNSYLYIHWILNFKYILLLVVVVAERPHNKRGSSVFVRDGLKVNSTSVCEEDYVEFITVVLPGVVIPCTNHQLNSS